jgi:S-DNA-T family DNA segregation ATPase FtsK/SpoIIIE
MENGAECGFDYRDELVTARAYNRQDPDAVLDEMDAAAHALAAAFAALIGDQWDRPGVHVWPTARPRTMTWLGRHTVHELEHHLQP